jgi:uncharacterized protein
MDKRIVFTADARFSITPAEAGKPAVLSGYALVWNTLSEDRGGYKVRLAPKSATFMQPTMALFEHDYRAPIGNTENNTLSIQTDEYGAKVEIKLPDTTVGRDVFTLVRDKYLRGMSFHMGGKIKGKVTKESGVEIFDALGYDVDEVTITGRPAFLDTKIGIKSDSYTARTRQALQLQRLTLAGMGLPDAACVRSAK